MATKPTAQPGRPDGNSAKALDPVAQIADVIVGLTSGSDGSSRRKKRRFSRRTTFLGVVGGLALPVLTILGRRYKDDPSKVRDDAAWFMRAVRSVRGQPDPEPTAGVLPTTQSATPAVARVEATPSPSLIWPPMPRPTPTEAASPSPSQVFQLPSVAIDEAWFDGDLVKVHFTTRRLPVGSVPWAFIMASGNPRWYPSQRPIPSGDSHWFAILSIGQPADFTVYVFILDPRGRQEIEEYLKLREEDGQWGVGMVSPPESAIMRAEWPLNRPDPPSQRGGGTPSPLPPGVPRRGK